MEPRRTRALLGTALAFAVLGGGCGDTKDDKVATGAGVTTTAGPKAAGDGKALTVTGADYEYQGVPKTAAAGTVVSFKNSSNKEVHEIVALRVKDGENRPLSDLLALPEAESDKVTEFRGVVVAFPGEAGVSPEGPLTLSQPGRYVFLCGIPTGADPVAYKAAAAAKKGPGPVEVPGGPPHLTKGMVAELTVT